MNQSTPFVSIILPVFNEEKYLEACLKRLRSVRYPKDRYEIITVDNGSTDHSVAIAAQYADHSLVMADVNVGAVRNFGVQRAKGSILAFLDSDCLVPVTWLEYGARLLQDNQNCVFGGNLYLRENPAWVEKYWLLNNPQAPLMQKDLLGSCIFIHKQHFLDASGFNEQVTSGEDSELAVKLRSMNHEVVIDRTLGVVHLGNPTTIKGFLKRQIWHSENYIKAIKSSLTDVTFWLVLIYLFGLLGLLSFSLRLTVPSFLIAFALLMPPFILGIRRIFRAHFKIESAFCLISIFLIDNLYLLGRGIGTIKGIFNRN